MTSSRVSARIAVNNLWAAGIPVTRRSWRAARELLAEADAVMCAACNGRPGPCTCGRGCRCGHGERYHEHYRANMTTDCGTCGPEKCPRYRRQRRFRLRA